MAAQQSELLTVVRIGSYVERYYARAQSIVADEAVVVQPLQRDLTSAGFARRLQFELRLEWNPEDADNPATVVRRLISATGPRLGPPKQPDCLDPRAVSPEPLAFLLPDQRHKFRFTMAGTAMVEGRPTLRVDYRPLTPLPPQVTWDGECGKIELPGRIRGRVWADPLTAEIVRFDESLVGQVDLPPPPKAPPYADRRYTIERADSTTHYRKVNFEDPTETLMLPSLVESVTVIQNSGVPRLRVTQRLTNYRRFVTASRVLP